MKEKIMDELIKAVAKKADSRFNFKKIVSGIAGNLLELFDGKIIEGALSFGVAKIHEDYHDELKTVFEAYLSGDYSKVQFESIKRLNSAIDLPGLDEEDEGIILEAIVGAFFKIVEKHKLKYTEKSAPDPGGGPSEPRP